MREGDSRSAMATMSAERHVDVSLSRSGGGVGIGVVPSCCSQLGEYCRYNEEKVSHHPDL
jgi:hypothetical protein